MMVCFSLEGVFPFDALIVTAIFRLEKYALFYYPVTQREPYPCVDLHKPLKNGLRFMAERGQSERYGRKPEESPANLVQMNALPHTLLEEPCFARGCQKQFEK